MSLSLRRLLLAALAVGVLVGALAALVLPAAGSEAPSRAKEPAGGSAADPEPAPAGDPRRPQTAPARPVPGGQGYVVLRPRSRPRIELRRRDPRGGPDWAIRTFRASREVDDRPGRAIGRNRCAQLGRLYQERFGWIDARNVFRPVGVQTAGAPHWCGSRRPDLGGQPHFEAFSRITDPDRGVAVPVQAVAWGIAGPAGRPALTLGRRAVAVPQTATGAFLVVGAAGLDPTTVRLEVRYPGRSTARRGGAAPAGPPVDFRSDLPAADRPALPGSGARPRLAVRTPDPAGGLPWGVETVAARGGGSCVSGEARIVGDRIGGVDSPLGTFTPRADFFNGCPTPSQPLTRRRPVSFGYGGGGGDESEPGRDADSGRRTRRTLPGRFSITGRAHPDVRSLTIATPRDVRTLRPAPGSGAFLAVYDGGFPTGSIVLTSRLKGGAVRTERFEPGF